MKTASQLLDEHHDVVGVSDFDDAISDTCAVCRFAVGWVDDEFGHDTDATVAQVRRWISRPVS